MPNRPWGGEGEADSRVGSGGPVPNKPLTTIAFDRESHTINPLPKNGFGPPHLWYDSPPPFPFVYAMSFSLEETGTDQTNPTFWGLQNWFWRGGGALWYVSPLPPKIARYVLPPPLCEFPIEEHQKPQPPPLLRKVSQCISDLHCSTPPILYRSALPIRIAIRHAGKKKPYTALLQCRTFLCRKKWGPQRKNFGGGYGFPGFHRVFVSTTGLESFSLRPAKFSKRFSFGGGCVRYFLLCHGIYIQCFWGCLGGCCHRDVPQLGSETLVSRARCGCKIKSSSWTV